MATGVETAAAAKALYISQPSLSATVARLEAELGFKIFYRDTSPISLTPEGHIYIVLSYAYNPKLFDATPILREQLVFAVHRETKGIEQIADKALSWEKIATASYTEEEKIDDFSVIRTLPFIAFSPETATGKSMHEIMGSFKKSSHAVTNFKDLSFHYIAMYAGVTPLLLPDIVISQHKTGDEILYFVPKNECSIRTVHACVKKGRERNRIADAFVDTLQEVCRSGFPLSGLGE